MDSLVKCAGCGKKPGVKTSGQRNSWSLGYVGQAEFHRFFCSASSSTFFFGFRTAKFVKTGSVWRMDILASWNQHSSPTSLCVPLVGQPRTAVCNAPCNERGGPRYDNDDGIANSAFTSGLRATGAQDWGWIKQNDWGWFVRSVGVSNQHDHAVCQPKKQCDFVIIVCKTRQANWPQWLQCPTVFIGFCGVHRGCSICHLYHFSYFSIHG